MLSVLLCVLTNIQNAIIGVQVFDSMRPDIFPFLSDTKKGSTIQNDTALIFQLSFLAIRHIIFTFHVVFYNVSNRLRNTRTLSAFSKRNMICVIHQTICGNT